MTKQVKVIEKPDVSYIMNRACLRKRNLTEAKANQIIDGYAERGICIYYYKCQFCQSFHLTSRPPVDVKEYLELI